MTEKDFILIASVIRAMRGEYPDDLLDSLVEVFVAALNTTNSRFDADKFREACK